MDKVGIKENTNFKVCAGSEAFINTIFLSKGIPQIMCYSKKLILQKVSFETIDVEESLVQLNK